MQDIKIHFINYSHVQIECSDSILMEMREYFSFEVEGARFQNRFKYGGWDGRIRLLDYNGKLPIGLTKTVGIFAKNMGYSVWVDPRLFEKEDVKEEDITKWCNDLELYSGANRITPHWYQSKAVFEGIHHKRRMLVLPTSAGKSAIACMLSRWYLENYEGKVLIIVPTTSLVLQMRDDFVDYRQFPYEAIHTIMSGTSKHVGDRLIVVSTWQSACKQPREWFQQFGMTVVDECFDGDTLIKTPNGDVKIKDIKAGDLVYSTNEETGEIEIDEVVKVHENMINSSSERMLELEMECGTIIQVTANHKFMTQRGWVRADELTPEDEIEEWKDQK